MRSGGVFKRETEIEGKTDRVRKRENPEDILPLKFTHTVLGELDPLIHILRGEKRTNKQVQRKSL